MRQPQQIDEADFERRLAAVVFIDLVGYSALMQQSESRAQAAVEELWRIARPRIARCEGEEVRLFGDGMLAMFPGTLAAARCCLQIFEELHTRNLAQPDAPPLRVHAGLHTGDIGLREGEIFGDGVNLASRLAGIAPPGALVISAHVRDQLASTLEHPVQSIGHKRLKNIKQPQELFCLPGPDCAPEDLAAATAREGAGRRRWHFATASFDETSQQLTVAGRPVRLGVSSERILECLLRYAGETVSREELRAAAGDIADSSLSRGIDQLRKALGDDAHRCIRTQPGQGYRLAASVRVETISSEQQTQFDFRPGDRPPMRPMWSLKQLLGQGGQGEAWLAAHDKTAEKRVYKFALDDAQLGFLKREITLSRVLQSSSQRERFIRVLDWNLDRAPFFLECEYAGEGDLLQWARQQGGIQAVEFGTRLDLLAQIGDALAAAHSVGVLHKDLKPANILLHQPAAGPPQIKLADFGSGEVLDPDQLDQAGITRLGFNNTPGAGDGSTLGTPLYLAPEVLSGQVATVQADVYALGVMLYQFVAGDLGKPLSTGWEREIADPLLREDIRLATEGDPELRLADAASLARRLRTLDARRREQDERRAAEQAQRESERKARVAEREVRRLRVRRRLWLGASVVLSAGLSLALYSQHLAREAEAESRAVAAFLGDDLFNVVTDTPLRELTVKQLLDQAADKLSTRAAGLPAVSAQLHLALGNAYYAMEDGARASEQFQAALEGFQGAGRAGSAKAAGAAAQLLSLNRGDRKRREALLPQVQAVLRESLDALGAEHPQVLALRTQIALAQHDRGAWQAALAELQAVTRSQNRADGGTSFASAQTRLGEVLLDLGDFQASAEQQEAVLASQPPPHARLGALLFLSLADIEQEAFDPAEAHLREAEQLANRWTVGPASALVDNVRLNRGLLRLRQGRAAEAVTLLQAGLDNLEQHPFVRRAPGAIARYYGWLADALLLAGKPGQAVAAARLAVDRHAQLFGPAHPRSQALRIGLAEALRAHGDAAQAQQLLDAVALPPEAELDASHPYRIAYHRARGRISLALDRPEAGRRELDRALSLSRHRYGERHRQTRQLRAELAQLSG